MKVIVVGAKPKGKTDAIVEEFVAGAKSAGHEVDVEYLFSKSIYPCIDCQTCKKTGGVCVWKDDAPSTVNKLVESDVIVLASPVYFFSISAQLKALLD